MSFATSPAPDVVGLTDRNVAGPIPSLFRRPKAPDDLVLRPAFKSK